MAAAIALPGSMLVWRYTELRSTATAMFVPGIFPGIIYLMGWIMRGTWVVSPERADRMIGVLLGLIIAAAVIAALELRWLYGHTTRPAQTRPQGA